MMRSSITHTSSFLPEEKNRCNIITEISTGLVGFFFSELTTVVRLPQSKAGGVGLSTGWQGKVEEECVGGGGEVELI